MYEEISMRLRPNLRRRTLAFAVIFILALAAMPSGAQTYTVIHSFGSGTDGFYPVGGLWWEETLGTYYGTTEYGGASDDGTIFRFAEADGVWNYSVVHSFDGSDGYRPFAAPGGGLGVGTTFEGGLGYGTIYDLSGAKFSGPIYSFCSLANCSDGAYPMGGVVNVTTTYFGTAEEGGAYGQGTLWKLVKSGFTDPTYTFSVLHAFAGGSDGAVPASRLIDNIYGTTVYGTTVYGGPSNLGTVFALDTSSGEVTILHSFSGPDGELPIGALYLDNPGGASDIFGTTQEGGADGWGTVFEISAAGEFSVLHSFTGGADGAKPEGDLTTGNAGNNSVIGTTFEGGANLSGLGNPSGTVFNVTTGGVFTVLYTFCTTSGCPDGAGPAGALVGGGSGDITGVTTYGGAYNKGVAFQYAP
jgi:uncharacterized repeat protein (TIGR03803 family)